MTIQRKTGRRVPGCAVALILLAAAMPARAHLVPQSDEEMVRAARHVVVATVTNRAARWNDRQTLILTEYTLAIESVLRGDPGRELKITVAGGTLDGETHASCLTVQLEAGRRYLLFLNDPEQPTFSTFTGGIDGVFVEQPPAAGATAGATTVGGGGGAFAALRGSGSAPGSAPGAGAPTFGAFVERVRAFVSDVASRPAPAPRPSAVQDPPLPAKTWDPSSPGPSAPLGPPGSASSGGAGRTGDTGRTGRLEPAGGALPATSSLDDGPVAPPRPDMVYRDPSQSIHQGTRGVGQDYNYARAPARYIVWNELPPSFAPWSPNDQYMMARWNSYGDIHRISGAPTGNWAWGNNRYDMTGWPSSQDMMNNFGQGWGANELAICWTRWFGDGPIVEADISMNPAFGWTLDDVTGTNRDDTRWSYPQTVLHELGHGWGLAHPWETQDMWWDSVMNYAPKEYRYPLLFADDTNAIRAAYPGIGIHDGLVKMWTTWDAMSNNNAGYSGTVPNAGSVMQTGSFGFNQGFTIENIGTDNLVNPQVEVYLTPNRLDWSGNYYLQTLSYSATIGTYGIWTLDPGTVSVPWYTPPGDYYVAFWLRDDTDPYTYNNGAWAVEGSQVLVTSYPWTIYPEAYWQVQSVTLGRNGQYDFYFYSDGAQRVDISTCPSDGGSADFDTILEVHDPSYALVAYSDDACGLQSRVSIDAGTPGTYHVGLRGFGGAAGNTSMVYRKRSFAGEALQLYVGQDRTLGWIILDLYGEVGPFDVERATLPDFSDATRLATETYSTQIVDPVQADGISYFYRAR